MSLSSAPKDTDSSQTEAGPDRLVLEIRGLGPIPSFKTGKRGTWARTAMGKLYARPVTKKEHARWMRNAIQVIELQLLSAMMVWEEQIRMELPPRSLTASPGLAATFVNEFDDKWKFVRRLIVESEPCDKGCVGATITIERL